MNPDLDKKGMDRNITQEETRSVSKCMAELEFYLSWPTHTNRLFGAAKNGREIWTIPRPVVRHPCTGAQAILIDLL